MKLTGVNLSFLNLSTPFKSFTVPKYTKLVIPEPTAESSSNPELYVSLIFDFSVISWRGSLQKSSLQILYIQNEKQVLFYPLYHYLMP